MRNQESRARSLSSKIIRAIYVFVSLGPAAAGAQGLCQPRNDAPGRECFVSLAGNDANPGRITQPFRTIAKGVSIVQAGDVLSLRSGVYVEPVVIAGKHGTSAQPLVIRSYPGERAFIDGSVTEFRTLNNQDWEKASLSDPSALPDEYVSVSNYSAPLSGTTRQGQNL
jgi:hypothetical protein